MKKMIEQPEVKVVKIEVMNVIATSGTREDGVTIQQLTTANDNVSIGF